jgi:iron complex transport system ATP-binding protein
MHDLAFAARFADEIVLLDSGMVRACGTPGEVLTEPLLAASFGIVARVATVDGRLFVAAERPIVTDAANPRKPSG